LLVGKRIGYKIRVSLVRSRVEAPSFEPDTLLKNIRFFYFWALSFLITRPLIVTKRDDFLSQPIQKFI